MNVVPQPSNGYTGVVASFAAGSAPDSLWVAGQYGPQLYESNDLIDLTDRFKTALWRQSQMACRTFLHALAAPEHGVVARLQPRLDEVGVIGVQFS